MELEIQPSSHFIPEKIGDLRIRSISWSNFKGKINQKLPYSAHIYWNIDYQILTEKRKKPQVKVDVQISPRSWVVDQKKSEHLLMHQYGHYLIGCMCALAFQKKVNHLLRQPLTFSFQDWCRNIFKQTLHEYLQLEKLYDEQTNHRLNFQKQEQWQQTIINELNGYKDQFTKRKSKQFKIHKVCKPKISKK